MFATPKMVAAGLSFVDESSYFEKIETTNCKNNTSTVSCYCSAFAAWVMCLLEVVVAFLKFMK